MRGDPPYLPLAYMVRHMSTPHARGSTHGGGGLRLCWMVYPACAGIHLRGLE